MQNVLNIYKVLFKYDYTIKIKKDNCARTN